MKIEQKVVRTYPQGYTRTTENLKEALSQGWRVIICNKTYLEKGRECLEYILERQKPEPIKYIPAHEVLGVLEEAAEKIENVYSGQTELIKNIQKILKKYQDGQLDRWH